MSITKTIFRMRSYQKRSFLARQSGCKRFVEVLHRRAGKDRNWINITHLEMWKQVGNYVHLLPEKTQAREVVWDNIIQERMADGSVRAMNMVDATFPPEMGFRKNETEMSVTAPNGSRWHLTGADKRDNIDAALRGPNPIGVVVSEAAFMSEYVWEVLSPILAENGGWVCFISTPNEEDDWFHKLYKTAEQDPTWFSQLLTIADTKRDAEGESGEPVITQEVIEDLRRHNVREENIQREYYCSWRGAMRGSIYGDLITAAEAQGRIARFPYVPQLPVGVLFDLGKSDMMACGFYQLYNSGRVFIDYHETSQKSPQWWAHYLREQKQYIYGRLVLPWDGWQMEAYLDAMNFKNIQVCTRTKSLRDSIDAVRLQFNSFYFDKVACAVWLDHLAKYKRKWDDDRKVFTNDPVHDEHSHGADALRAGVEGEFEPMAMLAGADTPPRVEMNFDPREPYGR